MKLADHIEGLEPLRIVSAPPADRPAAIALLARDIGRLPQWLAAHPEIEASRIIIADIKGPITVEGKLPKSAGDPLFMAGLGHLADIGESAPLFLFMPEWPLRIACMAVPGLASKRVYIQDSPDAALAPRAPLPDFFTRDAARLEEVYAALAGASDRDAYARRVKSLILGDPGYLRLAPFMEYEHPATLPQKGDVALDGGLSDMVGSQKAMADRVGESGVIHGFEPIAWMAEKAAEELRPWPQYRVHAKGLADRAGSAWFASLRDSSHLAAGELPDGEKCELTTIDDFCGQAALSRVDLIKLDVEGAELAALKGGLRTIRANMPRLMVCLYHKPQDMHEIPLFLLENAPGYELRVAHSSCGFTDTILYARKA